MPSQQLTSLIAALRAQPHVLDEETGLLRKNFDQMGAVSPLPEGVRCEPVDAGGVPGEWITPADADDRTVLYLHGGGYVIGSITAYRALAARIAVAARARALAIEYRLAPEHPYPAAIDDAVAAYRWLLDQGIAPSRLAVAGDSAGGGLTAATLIALRDAGHPLPAAAVLMSAWLDLTCTSESMTTKAGDDPVLTPQRLRYWAGQYLNGTGTDATAPAASPVHADLAGLPPMLLQAGTAEVLLDDSRRFAARARQAGVDVTLDVWDDMVHIWQVFFMLPEAVEAVEQIGAWLRERVGPS
jgi:acetyl esterase/lipase